MPNTRTTRSKKRKQDEKASSKEKKPKRSQKGIDMSHIPKCLVEEGFTKEEEEISITKVPDYLLCPICKELFVEPEMFRCGHTVCKVCKTNSSREWCPVCKIPMFSEMGAPNFVLKQLIEDQFPALFQKRKKELEETLALQQLRRSFERCVRFRDLVDFFRDYMMTQKYTMLPNAVEHLKTFTTDTPVSVDEAKFVVGWSIQNQVKDYHVLGNYVLYCHSHDAGRVADWLSHNSTPMNRKWAPLIMFSIGWANAFGTPDQYAEKLKALAKIYKVEFGSPPTDFLVWNTKPPHWLKDMPSRILSEQEIPEHPRFHNYDYDDSESEDEDGWLYSDNEELLYE